MIDAIQTILLAILVDRSLFIRSRYKIAFEVGINHSFVKGKRKKVFACWIYCKKGQAEGYGRYGGKRLFHFNY